MMGRNIEHHLSFCISRYGVTRTSHGVAPILHRDFSVMSRVRTPTLPSEGPTFEPHEILTSHPLYIKVQLIFYQTEKN